MKELPKDAISAASLITSQEVYDFLIHRLLVDLF